MKPQPNLLYHYTNQMGLMGILKSKKLWATHIHFLNDTKEFWHSVERMLRVMKVRNDTGTDEYEKFVLRDLSKVADSMWHTQTYITSFSARRDSLSQWRGYVGDQPGFALGFDAEELGRLASGVGARFEACVYEEETQEKEIDEIISEILSNELDTSCYLTGDAPRLKDGALLRILEKINNIAPLHKHEAFSDEEEWRLIVRPDLENTPISFRAGHSMLIPYVEINLLEQDVMSCLREIVVGPCSNPEFALYSLQGLLHWTKDVPNELQVLSSTAPYRYW